MNKRSLLAVHKWLGLIAGVFILIMGLTGSILVFDDEIEHFIQRDVIYQPDSDKPVSLDNAYSSIIRKHSNWDVRFTVIPRKADRAVEAEIRRPDDRRYLYLHPVTGDILRDLDSESTFSYWMLKLHYQLHSGFTGEVILLFAGLMFIGSLITGFWFYRKAIKRVLTFRIRPRFRDLRTASSELHRSVGVWALVFNLITAVTGVVILLIIVQTHIQSGGKPAPLPAPPSVEASLDRIIASARQSHPGFDPTYIRMPSQPDRRITLYGHHESDLPIHYEFSNYVQYDPHTGTESNAFFIREQPVAAHLLSFTYPLHFGDWGGIIVKILYCLFGLAPAMLSITGFIIWRQRERKKRSLQRQKNPAPAPYRSQERSSRIDESFA